MNILLVAEESAGIQVLKALAKSSHRIVAVMAMPPKGTENAATVFSLAKKMGYEMWPAKRVKDPAFADHIRSEQIDILLNVHSLHIIHGAVVGAPRIGSFNIHPGPLPRYAGLNAPSWAIYKGEKRHGVTIHKMMPGVDTGPIVYQEMFDIAPDETGLSLSRKCVKSGVPLLFRLLDVASKDPDDIPLVAQDMTKREYFGKEVPNNGWLSWLRPAREIVNFVRACDYFPFSSPWGQPKAKIGHQEINIVKASLTGHASSQEPGTVGQPKGRGVEVASADEWVLISKLGLNGLFIDAAEVLSTVARLAGGV